MIRLAPRPVCPDVLERRGPEAAAAVAQAVERGEAPVFDRTVYAAPEVKQALQRWQQGKCAFCESKVDHVAYGDVEHFRPKAGWTDDAWPALRRPGYWWLAYDWDNLVFACELCNRRGKRSRFPLRPGGARAATPDMELSAELPMFVDPAREDPREVIGWAGPDPFGRDVEGRGEETICSLDLRRPELRERRAEKLRLVATLIEVLGDTRSAAHHARARACLEAMVGPHGEYLAMAREAFGEGATEGRRAPAG